MQINEKALIKKDIQEIVKAKRVLIPSIIIPIIFTVVVPVVMLIIAYFIDKDPTSVLKIEQIITNMPKEYQSYTPSQVVLKLMLDCMFPGYFLLIPIMCSSVIGASSFVSEREHKTMETLLYTPIKIERILSCKILGIFVPTYILTVISFFCLGIIMNIGGAFFFEKLIFPDVKWIVLLLWVAPNISFVALTFSAIVSAKSKSFQEAQQLSGILIIPIVVLIIVQMIGAFMVNTIIVIIFGALLFGLALLLINKAAKKFNLEELV